MDLADNPTKSPDAARPLGASGKAAFMQHGNAPLPGDARTVKTANDWFTIAPAFRTKSRLVEHLAAARNWPMHKADVTKARARQVERLAKKIESMISESLLGGRHCALVLLRDELEKALLKAEKRKAL